MESGFPLAGVHLQDRTVRSDFSGDQLLERDAAETIVADDGYLDGQNQRDSCRE